MDKINNNTSKGYHYTLIYFEVMDRLEINLSEYILLDLICHKSKKGDYTKGLKFLTDNTSLSINSVKKHLLNFRIKNFIKLADKRHQYYINPSLKEDMRPVSLQPRFIKIYEKHAKEIGLSKMEYAILYMFYSIAKNNSKKRVFAGYSYFSKFLKVGKDHYYHTKTKLRQMNAIKNYSNGKVEVQDLYINWFEIQDKLSKKEV